MHEEATEPPVEWVFELENGHAEEVLVPPASGPSNSWLSWLQGAHDAPAGHRQVFSRESDQSAGTLPCESRDPDALPGHEPRGVFGIMGNWFAEPDDNPLPPPMPWRMDEDDHSLGGHSSHHVKWAVDDEVVPERMQRTASQATSLPPASNMVVGSEAVRDAEVRSDYSDGFLADVAAAYMSAHGDDHRAPEPEPPLPPPERPPEGEPQGFYEVPLAAAAPMAYAVEKPRSPVQAADVAVIVESEESTGHTKCAKCKAACGCLCLKGQKSKTEEEEEAFRTTTTKLLDEEIQDFSGSAAHGCVAWVSHRCLARLPLCCVIAGFLISVTIISVGMVVRPLEVEIDWDSFLKTDVNTSTMRDVFLFALQHRDEKSERRLTEGRQLQGNRLYKHNDIFLAYQIPESANAGPDGLLGPAFLSKVRSFERKLRTTPEWIRLCNRSDTIDRPLCDLGVSLVNYVFPSPMIAGPDVVPSQLNYDAGGPQALAPQVAMVLMEDHNVKDIIIPPGYEEGTPLRTVRTAFRFKWFCCTSLQSGAEQRQVLNEMRDTWSTFLDDTVIPMLRQEVATRPENLEIYYTGSTLYSKEVTSTLFGDLMLAAGSISFVLFYLILHTQSILLGFMGLVIIVGAIPLSYVVFAVVTGSNTMSIASFLSVFLIVGLGSDVVFVYTDFWADSKSRKVNYGSRMTWTLIHAGKASLATSVTTALSFFANLASVLKPLREFGFFMGLCVIVVWLLLSLVYVPLCMVDEFWCRRCRLPCGQFFNYMKASPVKISPREESDGPDAHPTVSKYTRVIQKFRRSICVFPVVVSIGFIIWAVLVLRVDTGVPSIFPEDHNLNKGSEVLSTFYDTSQVFNPLWLIDRPQADVCNTAIFTPISSNYNVGSWAYNCNLNWCEADPDVSQLEDDTCHCWRRAEGNCSQSFATVSTKIIAPRRLVQEDEGAIADYFEAVDGVSVTNTQRQNLQRSALSVSPPIVTEEWERGLREVREVTEVLGTVQRDSVTASCAFQDVCFCNSWSCKMPGSEWQKVRSIRIPGINETTSRRLSGEDFEAQPRSLDVLSPSEYTVSPANRATVEAVFGITVTATSLLLGEVDLENGWTFAELHQVSQPWAQRNMYSFCTSFPKSLRVVEKRCWMESFRTWLLERGNRFPIVESQFRALIVPFAESSLTGMHSTKDFLWLRDGEVKASYVPITVDFATYADTASALDFKEGWDKYLDDFNLEASIYTKGAWHTSVVWVRAEAQSALIQSTIVTIVIVVALALLGMLVFTKDSKLSALVVASTLIVIFALTWFIVVVMAWPIGPIEVIALIVFIGYAVTYSLHIAHRYGSPLPYDHDATMPPDDIRFLRTVLALASIGGAALGSAVTTAGCSIFLVFCTLTIFQKLGGVVLVVTLMSIGVALIPLPAALLWFGPVRPGRCFCFYPTETYDNVINARVNMVENLQKRREEQNRLREEKAEMKRQESERKQLEKEAEEERMKKEKEEEEARQRREAQEKARQLAKGKSKAKAKASLSRTRSLESGDVKRTSTASQDRRRSDGELAPQVAPHRSSDIKASASRASGDPTPSSRLTASGLDVGEEATREVQGH